MKIIFCFDGTCNSPDTFDDYLEDISITNILKLHAMFGGSIYPLNQKNTYEDQKSHYYSGVGTRGNKFWRTLNALVAPPHGDLEDILDDAFQDLKNSTLNLTDAEYSIYIFGFSRGAAIARMFAAKVAKENYNVRFLGVFDTVAATKSSLDLDPNTFPASGILFENGTIGDHIVEAVHLVALDEKRVLFQPTLFNAKDNITEVWFSGVHSDVGGGYWFDGLSDVALKFMIERVKAAGLTICEVSKIDYLKFKPENAVDCICADDLVIKPLVNGKIHLQNVDSLRNKKLLAPRLVKVNENDLPSTDKHPIIHHSVVDRFNKVPDYRPYVLRNVTYKVWRKDGTIGEPQMGIMNL